MRLRICAFGAFVITSTAAIAQDVQTTPETIDQKTGPVIMAQTTGPMRDTDDEILLGRDKASPLCPDFCAPLRVTSPEQATVGEREVMTYTLALATAGSKLHVDSRRSTWARLQKFPSTAPALQPATVVTTNDFRPALDPVLAEPAMD